MNILILNWRDPKNPKSGGAEIVTHEHAKYWAKNGHNVTWFTSQFRKGKPIDRIDNIKIIRQGNSGTVYLYAFWYYLKNNTSIDIVIDEIHGIPFFTPLYVRKPKIAFIHEVAKEIWDYMYPFPINKLGKLMEPIYFHLYKNVPFWVPSKSTINELVTYGIPQKNCQHIVCPMLCKVIDKLPQKERELTIVFVSRLVRMKGVEDVILAFQEIQAQERNAVLWIVGTGEERYVDHLKEMASGLNVKFFGKVSETKKIELMKRAHLLMHASVKEGWGLVIVEAASQATPSVTYNVSGLRDSVLDKKTGILTKKNTPHNLAICALSLYRDSKLYKEFQNNCLAWAKSLKWEDAKKKSLALIVSTSNKSYERN